MIGPISSRGIYDRTNQLKGGGMIGPNSSRGIYDRTNQL